MRVIVAPDKFRGSLTAAQAADAIADGVLDALPSADVLRRPVADGGEGTLDALVAAGWQPRPIDVTGPTGARVRSRIAWREDTAAVELADCCGRLHLLEGVPAPTTATTRGLGAAIDHAARGGASTIVIGVGGSASTDGGLGLLGALGVRVLDADACPVRAPLELVRAASIDTFGLDDRLRATKLVLATDVRVPLLGATGAARLFGPQKGASAPAVDALEAAMTVWARVLAEHAGRDIASVPGAGAGGGVVAGVLGVLTDVCAVEILAGPSFVLDAIGLADDVVTADAVVVGEGSLDAQSLLGKAPTAVARLARDRGCRVVAVAGRLDLDSTSLRTAGIDHVVALTHVAESGEDPERDAAALARRAGALLTAWLA